MTLIDTINVAIARHDNPLVRAVTADIADLPHLSPSVEFRLVLLIGERGEKLATRRLYDARTVDEYAVMVPPMMVGNLLTRLMEVHAKIQNVAYPEHRLDLPPLSDDNDEALGQIRDAFAATVLEERGMHGVLSVASLIAVEPWGTDGAQFLVSLRAATTFHHRTAMTLRWNADAPRTVYDALGIAAKLIGSLVAAMKAAGE